MTAVACGRRDAAGASESARHGHDVIDSLLDRPQSWHADCIALHRTWTGPVVSTEAVLTEATRRLSCAGKGRATLVPTDSAALRRAGDGVRKYDSVPMDFADAALVVPADELDTESVIPLDADFDILRRRGGAPLPRVPG